MNIQYRKKPLVIEALQFTGDNLEEICHFAGLSAQITGRDARLKIITSEGAMTVSNGDWVIRGIRGEFYPCKPDVFDATYEEV